MMSDNITNQKIVQNARKTMEAEDKAFEEVEKRLNKLYAEYFALYPNLVTSKKEISLITAAAISEEARILAQDLGLNQVLQDYVNNYPVLQKQALKYYSAVGLPAIMEERRIAELNVLVGRYAEKLKTQVNEDLFNKLEESLFNSVQSTASQTALVENIIETIPNITTKNANLIVQDTYAGFTQTVHNKQAEDVGLQIYQYIGPFDEANRPACRFFLTEGRHGVPDMWLKEEITVAAHPDLTRDPLIYRGSYRCRHSWAPVTLDYAKSRGFKVPAIVESNIKKSENL